MRARSRELSSALATRCTQPHKDVDAADRSAARHARLIGPVAPAVDPVLNRSRPPEQAVNATNADKISRFFIGPHSLDLPNRRGVIPFGSELLFALWRTIPPRESPNAITIRLQGFPPMGAAQAVGNLARNEDRCRLARPPICASPFRVKPISDPFNGATAFPSSYGPFRSVFRNFCSANRP